MLSSKSKIQLPGKYQELADVFKKKNVDILLLHQDCPINLQLWVKIPVGQIYTKAEPECAALHNLKKRTWPRTWYTVPPHSWEPLCWRLKRTGVSAYASITGHWTKHQYLLPFISVLLDWLKTACLTKLVLWGAYNLVWIHAQDEWQAVFRNCYIVFKCLVMTFGLTNTLVTLQHFINDMLRDLLDQFVIELPWWYTDLLREL